MYNRIRTYATCVISAFLLAACAPSPITKDMSQTPKHNMNPKTEIYTSDQYKPNALGLILSDNLSKMGITMLLESRKEEAFRSKATRIALDSLAVTKLADEVSSLEDFEKITGSDESPLVKELAKKE